MDDDAEQRKCESCGYVWTDTGDLECPECGSDDTYGGYDSEDD